MSLPSTPQKNTYDVLKVSTTGGTLIGWLPNPKTLQVDIQDVDYDSGRNQSGTMTRDRVGIKRKVNLTFPPLSETDMRDTLNAIGDVFMKLEYPDPQYWASNSNRKTITCYVGDRSAPMWNMINGNIQYENLSVNFIEK